MKKRFTDEHVIAILREAKAGATPIKALCKKHDISEQTFLSSVGATASAGRMCPTPGG